MTTVTKQAISIPDCCFVDMDITSLCTGSFFSWGASDEEDILESEQNTRQAYQHAHIRKSHPLPVIALNQSSLSNTLSHVPNNFDDSVEDCQQRSRDVNIRNPDCISSQVFGRESCHEKLSLIVNNHARMTPTIRNYAALHEMLINSLFEDAQARHLLKLQQTQLETQRSTTTLKTPSPEKGDCNRSRVSKPRRILRNLSTVSSMSSRTTRSRSSSQSMSSHSDILTPSSHRFKQKLSSKRRRVYAFPIFSRRLRRKNRFSSLNSGNASRSSGATSTHEELSSCASSSCTNKALSFLHSKCRLQKDKGKGVSPGKAIVAYGRYDAMSKLGEKIDLLVEMEQDGTWSNAALTRVPAKITTPKYTKEIKNNIVESRSMIGLKLGFLSIKYGVLIHWNTGSGQADLILLRKMCSDTFLKDRNGNQGKTSWKKRTRHVNTVEQLRSRICLGKETEIGSLVTPFVTVHSNESSWVTDDTSL